MKTKNLAAKEKLGDSLFNLLPFELLLMIAYRLDNRTMLDFVTAYPDNPLFSVPQVERDTLYRVCLAIKYQIYPCSRSVLVCSRFFVNIFS